MSAFFGSKEALDAAFQALLREVPEDERLTTLAEMKAIARRHGAPVAPALPRPCCDKGRPECVALTRQQQAVVIAGAIRRPMLY